MWIANRLPACACAALLLGAAGRAHALSCALPELVAPSHASVAVPTNTLIWCSGPTPQHGVIDFGAADGGVPSEDERSRIRVTAPDGTGVSGTQTRMTTQAFELFVFHPAADLAADSEYQVNCPPLYAEDPRALSFTTGAGRSTTAPAVPDVSHVELNVSTGDGWGPAHAVYFHDAVRANSIVVIDLGGTQTLVPAGPSGQVATARYHGGDGSLVWVGDGPCGGDWREAALGASVDIALGVFDLTGAFSGWTERRTYTLPSSYPAPASPLPAPSLPEPAQVDGEEDAAELDDALPASAPSGSSPPRDVAAPPVASQAGCSLRTGHALRASAHDSTWGAAALLTALAGLSVRISRRSRRAPRG